MLNFIGTGSAFNTSLGNNGAYIKHNKTLFMIDCGSNTFDRLIQNNVLDGIEDIIVLLTHTHPDHVGSLGDLIFYSYYAMGEMMKPKLTVLAPSELKILTLLKLNGVGVEAYHYKKLEQRDNLYGHLDFFIQITPVPINHVKELDTFAYVIAYKSDVIYYSGDANEIPAHILAQLQRGKFSHFYQDTCKADYPGNVHLSLRELAELVDEQYRSDVHCMHLDKGFDVEEAKELGFKVVSSVQ